MPSVLKAIPAERLIASESMPLPMPLSARKTPAGQIQKIHWLRIAEASAFPLLLLLLWQAASSLNLAASEILPSPALVLQTFARLWLSGELGGHLAISFSRVLQGFLLGGAIGIAVGLTMGVSRVAEQMIGPLFRAFCQVPIMAWLPLMMLVFGVGEMLKAVIIAMAVLVPMAINTFEGIRRIPPHYLEVAKVLRLRRRTLLLRLLLPAIFPPMFSGVRQGLSHAWVSLIGVELLASTKGVGYMMSWGRVIFQLDIVFAGVIVVGLVGLAMDLVLRHIERRLGSWRPATQREAS
ncbi:MAG: sulfonate transporter [Herbaspirillum sp.]|nr:sulfonate transporter [Herbaspirillum sp.]